MNEGRQQMYDAIWQRLAWNLYLRAIPGPAPGLSFLTETRRAPRAARSSAAAGAREGAQGGEPPVETRRQQLNDAIWLRFAWNLYLRAIPGPVPGLSFLSARSWPAVVAREFRQQMYGPAPTPASSSGGGSTPGQSLPPACCFCNVQLQRRPDELRPGTLTLECPDCGSQAWKIWLTSQGASTRTPPECASAGTSR